MLTFSFSPPRSFSEEGKWFLAVTSCEAINSVFKMNNENKSFSMTIPSHGNSKLAEKLLTN